MMKKIIIIMVAVLIALASLAVYFLFIKEVHEHVDFAVFIEGKYINFSKVQYMSNQDHHLSERVHLHDMNGHIIHKHARGVTFKEFFSTLGIKFSSTCFVIDNNSYCNNDMHKLRMFVNNNEIKDFENYEVMDLEKVLITFDNGSNIKSQLKLVTDIACIYSARCPERGEAVGESCVTGKDMTCS